MGIMVTNDPCRRQGTGKILLLEKQGQRAMEKRRAAEQNHEVLKETQNKTLHSCQCENPRPTYEYINCCHLCQARGKA